MLCWMLWIYGSVYKQGHQTLKKTSVQRWCSPTRCFAFWTRSETRGERGSGVQRRLAGCNESSRRSWVPGKNVPHVAVQFQAQIFRLKERSIFFFLIFFSDIFCLRFLKRTFCWVFCFLWKVCLLVWLCNVLCLFWKDCFLVCFCSVLILKTFF